ncbi:MAG: murein L,D-transpeptidase catalytic domain family protein [Bacteroidetes bacterium]|nr:murein L,D-transpeptidase catalytic domain family protein [Bacteroidota bacterium]MBU1484684.1 murein L,D-transpeptidase catalytic domain family protein [Bacteroidota bacterium]MBU2267524.1 murein L,D-transpeptidase catalytic domain family protein [Bacteroidota bacterium]MBU2376522.1 murein L,D-transpeptidase catalytic domain family protein [Bacteroidota bacterium]
MFQNRKRLKVYSISGILSCILFLTFVNVSWKTDRPLKVIVEKKAEVNDLSSFIQQLYSDSQLASSNLSINVFEKAMIGYLNLKDQNLLSSSKDILTIVDFTKPSTTKRMWIIDLKNKQVLLNTYVAHGQGSGADLATSFSNNAESHQSSLGFYVTSETYFGKHGLSLKLDGLDKGINDEARDRAIVVHGADYVSENFIKQTGRLGRSFGCPAVPASLNTTVINYIKDKTCLFINGKSDTYQSAYLNPQVDISNFPITHS